MRILKHSLVLIFLSLTSCLRNVDLAPISESRIVIEGILLEGQNLSLQITKTIPKTSTDSFPPVPNASVFLSTQTGQTESLEYAGQGLYTSLSIIGMPQSTYTLAVTLEGETFSATSTMPSHFVRLDSLKHAFVTPQNDSSGTVSKIILSFDDFGGTSDFGILVLSKNEEFLTPNQFYRDNSPEDKQTQKEWIIQNGLFPGDQLKVEFFQLEPILFNYFKKLDEINSQISIGGLNIAPPENLIGNFDNGAVGFFGAVVLDTISVVVE
jgi:Domain of unknown function (DUF4249)